MNVIAKFILVRCSYRPAESRQFYVSSIKKERFYIYLKKKQTAITPTLCLRCYFGWFIKISTMDIAVQSALQEKRFNEVK